MVLHLHMNVKLPVCIYHIFIYEYMYAHLPWKTAPPSTSFKQLICLWTCELEYKQIMQLHTFYHLTQPYVFTPNSHSMPYVNLWWAKFSNKTNTSGHRFGRQVSCSPLSFHKSQQANSSKPNWFPIPNFSGQQVNVNFHYSKGAKNFSVSHSLEFLKVRSVEEAWSKILLSLQPFTHHFRSSSWHMQESIELLLLHLISPHLH